LVQLLDKVSLRFSVFFSFLGASRPNGGSVMKRLITGALFLAVLCFGVSTPSHAAVQPHPAGCPARAFCGCGVSVKVFGHSVRDLWKATAWLRFRRTTAAPGMVAVWRHHVAYIISTDGNGNAVLYDPNSGGHKTRIHERSIRGATIVDPSGAKTQELSASSRNHRRSGVSPPKVERWGDNIH
jgi:hypothetical protein